MTEITEEQQEEFVSKGTIAVCTPMYGDMAHREYINTLLLLSELLRVEGYGMSLVATGNESLISRARNLLVHKALKIEDLKGVLFLDADQGVDPEGILDLIESDKDIIGAIVPKKSINWTQIKNAVLLNQENLPLYSGSFAVSFIDPDKVQVSYTDPIEVKHIGTGVMYVSAKVFSELRPLCKIFSNGYVNNDEELEEVVEYFKTVVTEDTNEMLSEDYTFCELWRSTGGSVWALPSVEVTHSGSYTFRGSFLHTVDLVSRLSELKKS